MSITGASTAHDTETETTCSGLLSSFMSRWTRPIECIHPSTSASSPNIRRASASDIRVWNSARKSKSSPPDEYSSTRHVWYGVSKDVVR